MWDRLHYSPCDLICIIGLVSEHMREEIWETCSEDDGAGRSDEEPTDSHCQPDRSVPVLSFMLLRAASLTSPCYFFDLMSLHHSQDGLLGLYGSTSILPSDGWALDFSEAVIQLLSRRKMSSCKLVQWLLNIIKQQTTWRPEAAVMPWIRT